jgi:hypothetical protein
VERLLRVVAIRVLQASTRVQRLEVGRVCVILLLLAIALKRVAHVLGILAVWSV